MVLTVEPGCYFQPDDATVPERFRGIGVRIEDDIAVTSARSGESLGEPAVARRRRRALDRRALEVANRLRRHDRRAGRRSAAIVGGRPSSCNAASWSSIGQRPKARMIMQISGPTPGTRLSSESAPLYPALAKIRQ